MSTQAADLSRRNDVFICYSEPDTEKAEHLEKQLKGLKLPGIPSRSNRGLQVFRDELHLHATEHYDIVEAQLSASNMLLVICSPSAARDTNLANNIDRFLHVRPATAVVPVILDIPKTGAGANPSSTLPENLRQLSGLVDPLYFSGAKLEQLKIMSRYVDGPWQTLLGLVFETTEDEINHALARLLRNRARNKRILATVAAAILLLVVAGIYIWQQAAADARRLAAKSFLAQTLQQSAVDLISQQRQLEAAHQLAGAISLMPADTMIRSLMEQIHPLLPAARANRIMTHNGEVMGAAFDASNRRVLSWAADNTARIWDATTGEQIGPPFNHNGWVYGARFIQNEKSLLSWGSDSLLRIWDVASGRLTGSAMQNTGWVYNTVLNANESIALTLSEDYRVRVWDLKTQKELISPLRHDGWINGVLFDESERSILTWSDDSTARVWDIKTGKQISRTMIHQGEINSAVFDANCSRILTAGNDGEVRLWNKNGAAIGAPFIHDDEVDGAVFSQDEKQVLSWARDHSARLWDLSSTRKPRHIFEHNGWVFGAQFADKTQHLLTWSYDNSARIWNLITGEPVGAQMFHSTGPGGSDAGIFAAMFNNDESNILTLGDDNAARLWDAESGELLGSPLQHRNFRSRSAEIKGAVLSQNDKVILTWGTDSTARLWQFLDVPPGKVDNIDFDFPAEHMLLQVQALTGTRLDGSGMFLGNIESDEWLTLLQQYHQVSRSHFVTCEYPKANLWRRFFPERARASRQ